MLPMASGGGAPDALSVSRKMKSLVNAQDIEAITKAQISTLERLEKSNEMISNCNSLSAQQLALANEKFTRHTATLQEMRKDLQSIFTRIRSLRTKLKSQYPGEYSMALENEMQNVSFQEEKEATEEGKRDEKLYDSSTKGHFSQNSDT